MSKHINSGNCQKCEEILNKYGGTHKKLKEWFKDKQSKNYSLHCSCSGRDRIAQNLNHVNGNSNAEFGKSPHNYKPSLAIDIFFTDARYPNDIYPIKLFEEIMESLDEGLEWFGSKESKYYELPHIQLKNWKTLIKDDKLELIIT